MNVSSPSEQINNGPSEQEYRAGPFLQIALKTTRVYIGWCRDDLTLLIDIIEALKSAKLSQHRIQFKITAYGAALDLLILPTLLQATCKML